MAEKISGRKGTHMTTLGKTFSLLIIASLFISIYLLQPILMPFLVGMALAYLGDPLVDRLEAMGTGRTTGVFLVFLVFLVLITGVLLILLPIIAKEIAALIRDIPRAIILLQETTSPFLKSNFGIDPFDLNLDELKAKLAGNWQQAGGIAGQVLSRVTASSFVLLTTIANLALIPVVAFYLLRDWDVLIAKIRAMIPRDKETVTVGLVTECDEVLSAFLRGQLLIMFILGCIYAAGLYFVGLDLAFLIGMLAGLASIVPYLGFIVGIIAAAMAAIFQYHDLIHLVYVAIVFGVGQLLEGTVLTPLLVGDRIGLHPVAVIFAILAGGQLFGFVGVLLALPVAAIIMVFIRHLHDRYKESEYYSLQSAHASMAEMTLPEIDAEEFSGSDQGDLQQPEK
jgi:predicted PurR-regulated permease PerM